MKTKIALNLAATAAALLVAACGGGGADAPASTAPITPALKVTGTAATGAAITGAPVEVKCAVGTSTAITATDGAYAVEIPDGALPCMVEVRQTVNGATVSLHSLADAGTFSAFDRRTNAVANVTPLTEMIVAQLAGALPEDSFKGFKGDALTPAQVQAAVAAIVAALKTAGIDFTGIDPLKASLVAGTSGGKGNAYDQLLDALGAKIDRDALKMVVNQIAAASLVKSEDGLKNAMQAVSGGSLAGCPVAVSGKYRSVSLFGGVETHTLDFTKMTLATAATPDVLTITPDPANTCVFTASGTSSNVATEVKVVFGANGVGTFRSHQGSTADFDTVGYLIPAQSHAYSDFRGTWSSLQTDLNARSHDAGQVTFGEEKKVTTCAYDSTWTCVPDTATLTATEMADGGLQVPVSGTEAIQVYGYRAPNGAFALFGANTATSNVAVSPKILLAAKLAPLAVPAVGAQVKSWDASYNEGVTSTGVTAIIAAPAPISFTFTAADAAAGTATRRNDATGRIENLRFNQPIAGVRTRDAGTFGGVSFPALYQVPLVNLGVTLSINATPFSITTVGSSFIYNIAVIKP